MAIKVSNQITFTEHKKIVEIKEWYLATSTSTGITTQTDGWTEEIQTMDRTNKYLWNYEEVVYSIGSSDISEPVIIGVYGETGSSLQVKYIASLIKPIIKDNDVSEWSDTIPTSVNGQKIYMTQKISTDINWSTPIQISAADGEPGKDGASVEYVYYRSKEEVELSPPYYTNDNLPVGWTNSPQGITEIYEYEYVSVRTKPSGSFWGPFSTPVIWSKWGEKGQDGDGIEYKYYLSNSGTPPIYSASDTKWTDDPQGVSVSQQYEYVVQIRTNSTGSIVSSPSLWAKFGEDGVGISEIKNYYLTTTDLSLPETPIWEETVPLLSPTNKYLWNYETIIYTDGSSTLTDPAIIGVYGDSGTAAITFEIYSTQGFVFKETLPSIELKIAAFEGGEAIDGATYVWSWWDGSLNSGAGGYSKIIETQDSSFTINESDAYAFASLKCEMSYNEKTYEDYVVLTSEAVIYNAVVKFFDGSNIFHSDDLYLVAYIELYQNNNRIDTIDASAYCSGVSSVSESGVITSTLNGSFEDSDKMYFICKDDNDMYYAILGEYTSGTWKKISEDTVYTYTNSLYSNNQSNVIVISKESINKSQNIDFVIYKDGNHIADASTMVIDSNDPIVSITAPANPVYNQLWLDTSTVPSTLKIFTKIDGKDSGQWVDCSEHIGGTIFTSKPSSYSAGDLWILENGETCGSYRAGSMLKATTTSTSFSESHWIDAMPNITSTLSNVEQYFEFNKTTGLRIGQKDEKFHVNLSSSKMGFYEGDTEVVSISNKSANIDNLTVEYGLTADCSTTLKGDTIMQKTVNSKTYKYVWQVEDSNGSLSLALSF